MTKTYGVFLFVENPEEVGKTILVPVLDSDHNEKYSLDEAIQMSMTVDGSWVLEFPPGAQSGDRYDLCMIKETGEHYLMRAGGIPGSM